MVFQVLKQFFSVYCRWLVPRKSGKAWRLSNFRTAFPMKRLPWETVSRKPLPTNFDWVITGIPCFQEEESATTGIVIDWTLFLFWQSSVIKMKYCCHYSNCLKKPLWLSLPLNFIYIRGQLEKDWEIQESKEIKIEAYEKTQECEE